MSDNNKRIAKNTVYLFLRMLVSLFIGLYTSRAILDALGVQDYGIYNVVGGFVALLSILTGNLQSASARFITFELGAGDINRLIRTFSTLIALSLIFAGIILILGETIGLWLIKTYLVIPVDRLNIALWVYQFSLLAFLVNIWAIPYSAVVNAHEHMNFFALMGIIESFAKLGIVFLLYIIPIDTLWLYGFLMFFVSLGIRFGWGVYCKKHFEEVNGGLHIDKSVFKNIFFYSAWVTIGTSSGVLKEQGVNILINRFFGVLMNAPRGLATQVMGLITQFANNISAAIVPQITKSYASGNQARAISLTYGMAKAQSVMMLICAIPVFFETDYLLSVWLKDVPNYTSIFVRWAIILAICRTIHNSQVPLYLAIGKIRTVQIIGGSIIMMNIPIGYVFLKMGYPPESTMIIGAILELCATINVSIFLNRYIGYSLWNFYVKTILPILFVGFCSLIPPYFFKTLNISNGFFELLAVTCIAVISVCILSYIILLNRIEKNAMLDFVKNKIKKK